MNKIRTKAWFVASSYNPAMTVMSLRSRAMMKTHEFHADVYLEPDTDGPDGGGTYRVYGNSGQPLQQRSGDGRCVRHGIPSA